MIRVFAFLILVVALGAGFAWLADRPGQVVFVWQGYQVQTSLLALAIAVAVLCVVAIVLWQIYRFIINGPRALGGYFKERRQVRGYRALSQGMIAVGAGDVRLAQHYAGEARKLLRNEPLTGLLGAQTAQLAGRDTDASEAFADMLGDDQTVLLGLHGLFTQAQRIGDQDAADLYAEEAVKRAPGLSWAANAVLLTRSRAGDWEAALETLDRNRRHKVLDKKDAQRLRAVLLTAIAQRDEDEKPEPALNAALEAHKLAPDLVPGAVVAGRIAAQLGKFSKATTLLERSWKQSPHPDIAAVYTHLRAGDSTQDRLERARVLSKKLPGHAEGRRALARAAIDVRDFTLAREALAPDIRDAPPRGICLMMAEIENEETGDTGHVRQWLARALRAPRDPAWVADGHVTDTWAPTSPVTGRLDAYEWSVPPDDHAETATILDHAMAADAAPIAPPAPMIDVSPRHMAPQPDNAPSAASAQVDAHAADATSEAAAEADVPVTAVASAKTNTSDEGSGSGLTAAEEHSEPEDPPTPNTQPQEPSPEVLAAALQAAEAPKPNTPVPEAPSPQQAVLPMAPLEASAEPSSGRAEDVASAPVVQAEPSSNGEGDGVSAGRRTAQDQYSRAASNQADPDDDVVLPPPPDDPGPDVSEGERKRRFGLF
ncbi:MAG: heme biosynthesis HemY N-terminal domain-containing protein [Pseudomonadota bacterium]